MTSVLKDRVCVVGVGESAYGKRGTLAEQGELGLAVTAVRAACADAGLDPGRLDGFSSFHNDTCVPSSLAPALGVNDFAYAGMVWGAGGGGAPTAMLNATMAIATGVCDYAVVMRSIVQGSYRIGSGLGGVRGGTAVGPPASYTAPFGLTPPTAIYALRARRHMARYGTTARQFGAVAVTQRAYAVNNPLAVFRAPMTLAQHEASRMIVDPLRLFDVCMESDGATALVLTSAERARDLRADPVFVHAISTRTDHRWHSPLSFTEADGLMATSGHSSAARELWSHSDIDRAAVGVAGFYDGSSPSVLLALEDWGFCERGAAGAFVEGGGTAPGGALPTNTAGGNLSEAYQQGLNHLVELVRQLRGTSANQVPSTAAGLFAAGTGFAPTGGVLLRR